MAALRRFFSSAILATAVFLAVGTGSAAFGGDAPTASGPALDEAKVKLPLSAVEPAVIAPRPAPVTSQPLIPGGARNYYRSGRDRFDEQLWGEAINDLAKALQISPQYDEARVLLARAALLQGNTALAKTHLLEALKSRPDDVAVHQLLGDIAWRAHDASGASEQFRIALVCPNAEADRPEVVISHLFLGLALREQGYLAAAADELSQFLAATENPSGALNHPELQQVTALYRGQAIAAIGELNDRIGRPLEAIDAYRRAVAANPGDVAMRVKLARALATMPGGSPEAVGIVLELLRDDESQIGIGLLIEICGKPGSQCDADAELLGLAKKTHNAGLLQRIAARMSDQGKSNEASELLERLVELQPDRLDVYLELADLRLKQGDDVGYVNALAGAIRRSKDAYERVDAVLATARPKSRDELIAAARKAVNAGGEDASIRMVVLGRLLALDGKIDEAARVLGQATDADPKLGPAYAALAELKLTRGMWQAALDSCKKAEDAGVREATVYRIKGQALAGLDERQEAEKALQEAVRLNPKDAKSLHALAAFYEQTNQGGKAVATLKRIVESVDSKDFSARESLIRSLLGGNDVENRAANLKTARRHVAELRRLGAPANIVIRSEAWLRMANESPKDRDAALQRFRDALDKLTVQYPKDVDTALDLAQSYYFERNYQQALARIDRVLTAVPDAVRARELRARVLAKLMRYADAIAVWKGLLAERPRNAEWLTQLADVAMDAGEYTLAAETCRKLADREDLKDGRGIYRYGLVEALVAAKEWDAAIRASREWLDSDPENEMLRRRHIAILDLAGRPEDGLILAESWLKAKPNDPVARSCVAERLVALKRFNEANRRALGWLAARPEDINSMRILIDVLMEGKQYDEAMEIYGSCVDDPQLHDRYVSEYARDLRRARRMDESIKFWEDLTRGEPRVDFQNGLVRAYMDARRWTDAERVVEKMMGDDVANMNAGKPYSLRAVVGGYRMLATIYQYSGRAAKCHEALEKVLNLIPVESSEYVGACNDLGYLWSDSGVNLERAEQLTRIAAAEEPRYSAYLDSLGWVLYKQGKNDEAVRFLGRAAERSVAPDAVILEHHGDALCRSGDLKGAEKRWREALKAVDEQDEPLTPEHDDVVRRCRQKLDTLSKGGRPVPQPLGSEQTSQPADEK